MFNGKRFTGLLKQVLIIGLLILGSCHYYKSLPIEPVSNESLETLAYYKPNIIVHLANELSAYRLLSSSITDDTLRGILGGKLVLTHKFHQKSFLKKKTYKEDLLTSIHIYTTLENFGQWKIEIPLSAIKTVEIHEKDVAASVIGTAAIPVLLVGAVVVAGVVACACPQVESSNAHSTQFHGSLFPGAIFKSLKREDYLILDNVLVDDGNLNLKVFNNLPETEYIDQLQVLEVDHKGFTYLGVSNDNEFIAYNQSDATALSNADSSDNIAYTINHRDNLIYKFDNLDSPDELNSITLKYDKSNFSGDTKLIIRGKQTQWLETVANYIFMNIGKSYDKWVKRRDKMPGEKWLEKNEWQGVALNVYLKVNDKWKYVGSHHDGGTMSMRELVMDIDLNQVPDSSVELKLESAYKIWELDYVGITNDWSEDLTVNSLDIQTAVDEEGNDISNTVADADSNYHIQEGEGSYVNLVTKGPSMEASTIVLQGTGYYHHIRDYEHKANLRFFMKLNDKLGVQDLSKALDLYKDLNVVALSNN
jgi:hypothetical protein